MGKITFVPVGGLANRMRAVASAVALAAKSDSDLSIVWFQDWALNAPFSQLFKPVDRKIACLRDASQLDYALLDRPRSRNFHFPLLFQKLFFKSCLYERSITPLCNRHFDFERWVKEGSCVYMASYTAFQPYDYVWPENKSASQGKNMAARELIKRLNREFARELKKITFDRTGKIPERQKMLPDVPVPVVGASVPEKEADPVISVPVVVPEVIPAPLVPVKSAKPENQKAIRVEWLDGVFVEFDKLATLGDKSRIHLKIVNTNADDCEVDLYSGNLTVINEKGEESPIVSVKLGSKFNDRRVTALIVPDLPTEMVIEVSKLQSVALLQLKDFKNNIVKLRGLK